MPGLLFSECYFADLSITQDQRSSLNPRNVMRVMEHYMSTINTSREYAGSWWKREVMLKKRRRGPKLAGTWMEIAGSSSRID